MTFPGWESYKVIGVEEWDAMGEMSELPDEDILWKIAHIREERWVNMLDVPAIKDIAEQLEWYDLVEWIEEEVEIGSGHNYDSETWLKAASAAATGDRKRVDVMGNSYVHLDAGGEIKL